MWNDVVVVSILRVHTALAVSANVDHRHRRLECLGPLVLGAGKELNINMYSRSNQPIN